MDNPVNKLSPSITDMIRMDHTHVIAVFHRFKSTTSNTRKRALVRNACLALEVHAQLEEEIFYPALREISASPELEKSVPEHNQMRSLISRLKNMSPDDAGYDDSFLQLMRIVMHHVADEESTLLPQAERQLASKLNELGMLMTKRRMQLIGPHVGELATSSAQSFPLLSIAAAASTVLLGSLLFRQARGNGERHRWV